MSPVLNKRVELAPQTRAEVPAARGDVLVFRVDGKRYAVPLREVQEIVPMAELVRSPSLPAVADGFLNLAGRAVVVVRLSRLFGLPDQPLGLHTPLLVLRHSEPPLALLVEAVECIARVPEAAVLPIRPDDSFNGAVIGVATLGGRPTLLLAPDLLVLAKEQQCLAEFQDREQSRLRALGGPSP